MKDEIAKKILKMKKDELMSEPESDRDWELITALDLAIEALERDICGGKERMTLLEETIEHCEVVERRYRDIAEDYLAIGDYNNFTKCVALAEEEHLRLNYLKNYTVER